MKKRPQGTTPHTPSRGPVVRAAPYRATLNLATNGVAHHTSQRELTLVDGDAGDASGGNGHRGARNQHGRNAHARFFSSEKGALLYDCPGHDRSRFVPIFLCCVC